MNSWTLTLGGSLPICDNRACPRQHIGSPHVMQFDDVELQQHYERVVSLVTNLPEDLRSVCGLMDAFHWFSVSEGEHSPRARDIFQRLTALELRPALRK